MKGHAEIAGAGFGGLSLGALLAARGWGVRVHERSPEIREIGAGIFLHNNGLLALEDMGLMPELERKGVELLRDRMLDEHGRTLQDRQLTGASRVWSFPRQALIETLYEAAVTAGAEVVLGSTATDARPDGTLITSDGSERRADLVVAADGHRSRLRNALGLTALQRELPTTSIRFLIDGRELAPEAMTTEHWSDRRRIALAACGPAHTYIYMAAPAHDQAGGATPIDVESWSSHFPQLSDVFELLAQQEPFRASYSLVRSHTWSKGAVALLGDAAHALPPTLGQGTNLTLSNARSLVSFLEHADDVPTALTNWEMQVRGVVDNTQRWAGYYDWATKHWPRSLSLVRAGVIWMFGATPLLNQQLRVADASSPVMSRDSRTDSTM